MAYWVYLLRCNDGSLYAGSTTDLERRLKEHNLRQGAKYTASRLPVVLARAWEVSNWSGALKLEHLLKQCRKQGKEGLVSGNLRLEDLQLPPEIEVLPRLNKEEQG